MPDKAEASERCILCGQKMHGVPKGEDASTAQLFMLVAQAKEDAKVAEALRWCQERACLVRMLRTASGRLTWYVEATECLKDGQTPCATGDSLPAAVAALRKRVEGKAPDHTEKGK